MIVKCVEKAKALVEILPYLSKYQGKLFVIKYGGSAMRDPKIREAIMQDIALLKLVGIIPVVVHGGGPEINEALQEADIEPKFVNGLRVTDKETMKIVESVLAGKIGKEIVKDLTRLGVDAVGICGKDYNILLAKKKYTDGVDLGFVGEIYHVAGNIIHILLENNFVPVISPIGIDIEGNSYNINADYAAVAVASALKAEKLIFLTDVPGILKDVSDNSSVISRLSVKDVPKYIEDKTFSGGMIPKVQCCTEGIKNGVNSVYVLDGRVEHSLLLDIFNQEGFGTIIEE